MAAVLASGEIEAYVHRHIPISAAMGVRVQACGAAGATLAAIQKAVSDAAFSFLREE